MDFRRIIVFTILSFALMFGWNAWIQHSHPEWAAADKKAEPAKTVQAHAPAPDRNVQLATGQTIDVLTDTYHARIDTAGGDLRELDLLKQFETGTSSKPFPLMRPQPHTLVLQSGLLGDGLPTHHATFTTQATHYQLQPGQNDLTVTLDWQGDKGVEVQKTYTFHRDSYVIDVGYHIINHSQAALSTSAYFQLLRDDSKPEGEPRFSNTYHGAAVYTAADKFKKVSFSDVEKHKAEFPKTAKDGWVAMVQHYFVAALVPPEGAERQNFVRQVADHLFTAGVILPVQSLAPGADAHLEVPVYAGPESISRMEKVAPGLDRTVDYGWLTVVCVPIFWVMAHIHGLVGNWGLAIIILTILIKLVFFPLSASSYRSMAKMRLLQPRMQRMKEQFGDDKAKLHQAMMELYQKEKVNPLGGCLPIVIQIPVFLALYWVLQGAIELRHAPFFGWITDLSSPDPYYVLPIIMGLTMLVQTRLNPKPVDPMQAKMMTWMPMLFTVFFFFSPAGLVIYWTMNNILSIAQQYYITRTTTQTG